MVSIRTVFSKLKTKNKKMYIHNSECNRIESAAGLEQEKDLKKDIIYICTESQYNRIPDNTSCNLMIVYEEEPDFVLDRHNNKNVIVIGDHTKSIPELINIVNTIIANNSCDNKSEVDIIMGNFLDIACQGNVGRFLFAVYEVWGNPVIVYDTSFRMMYSEWGLSDKETMEAGYKKGQYLEDQSIRFLHDNDVMKYAAKKKFPFFLDTPTGHRLLFAPLLKSGVVIAILFVMEVNTPMNEEDLVIAEKIGKLFTLTIQNNKEFLYPLGAVHDQFFKELVSGSYTDPETVTLRIRLFHISLGTDHRVAVIASKNKKLSRESLSILLAELRNILDVKMGLLYKDRIALLISDNNGCHLSEFQTFRLSLFLKTNELLCVFSHDFTNIFFTRQHYLQALNLFDLVCRQDSPEMINFFEDYAFRVLIQSAEITTAKRELIHPVIEAVMEYDEVYGLDLLNTLKTYVFNLKHINMTADMLGIHRNTLFYRLKCLKEQMKINLDDAQTIFEIMFSFYVLEEIENDKKTFSV